ncbi:glycosyltransferase family 4 protein [Luteipulveratus sp. YIM 133132]|uniref:glycosyltransferase family 4 protein n=1 Tax=Luteipulveratus flavus TaxID=3031728 RepID=UPI0023AFC15A|nr:glycosyltransferase family 4 protein [Luteipulveratus sp. YIM 133132]MDE9364298.1 glycosyltransferase family 4 protein [Luteipulveratus sp. YIM 133132]
MKNSRIALVPSAFHPDTGGVEEHTRQVALGLADRGHHVEVWTVRVRDDAATDEVDGIAVRRLPCPLPSARPAAAARFARTLPAAWRAWTDAAARFRPDLLHVQCFGPNGVYADRLARRRRLPLVLSTHGELVADDFNAFSHSWTLRAGLRSAMRNATVTGCSEFALDGLRDTMGLPAGAGTVVPNGVDLHGEPPSPTWRPPADRYVLALGRAVHNKGFDLLLEAYARIAPHVGADLVIGGDGPALPALRARAAELGVGHRVHLLGRLARDEVAAAMEHASVLALPSRVESFGIVILEAWRAGVPVVATDRGGPAGIVTPGQDGLLVDPTDTAALAAALRDLLSDPARAAGMGACGRARVQHLTWDDTVAAYERLYASRLLPQSR